MEAGTGDAYISCMAGAREGPGLETETSMTAPLIVSIPHRLGREEATRRVKSGLDTVRTKLTQVMTIEEETWTDNELKFRVRALGQAASGTIDIAEDHARLEVMLPWPLAQIAEKVQRAVQSQGTAMLEKK
jgi:Putative polyhydroxyalkanoic acid system protein (PHA_gran_rgn)